MEMVVGRVQVVILALETQDHIKSLHLDRYLLIVLGSDAAMASAMGR